jgi:hypothetical protein
MHDAIGGAPVQQSTHRERAEYPSELAGAEDLLIEARRRAISSSIPIESRIGIGLSGGGIRSATFCLGVFQALARAKRDGAPTLIQQLDYLSTVSGGGYFGGFLGRLYTRAWVKGPADVERVLRGEDTPPEGAKAFRFLRDNGRYLAPRGSGDLLMMLAVALRNWIAVQTVLFTFALTGFVALQLVSLALPDDVVARFGRSVAGVMPSGTGIWWSWWFVWLVPIAIGWTIPTCWGYWVIGQSLARGNIWLTRRTDLLVLAICGVLLGTDAVPSGAVLAVGAVAATAGATLFWSMMANRRGIAQAFTGGDRQAAVDNVNLARNHMSAWFKYALAASTVIAIVALVDSLGATVYALATRGQLVGWIAGIVASFSGAAAFGRQVLVLLGDRLGQGPPRVRWSVLSWVVAVAVLGIWLIGVNAVSHGVAWRFQPPSGDPAPPAAVAPRLLDAATVVVERDASGRQVLRGVEEQVQTSTAEAPVSSSRDRQRFVTVVLILAAILTLTFGYSPTFLNLSTLHGFYSARLTRAYLGATNEARRKDQITDVIAGDDVPADQYWRWPRMAGTGRWKRIKSMAMFWKTGSPSRAPSDPVPAAIQKGAPLHLVNVTVNETLDARTGVQQQDRKGVPLAIGPAGLSLGVRHHLIADGEHGHLAPEPGGYPVFRRLVAQPEPLTLGRWVSISGAAFTPAAGARTTVPMAILATLANVRLGYWWESGLARPLLTRLLPPVYRGLLSEGVARLRGTADRLWNISDGGHFENLGGYELIRRRLPLIVLIDAEADPDYTFEGLANLVRKARLDFRAEIEFLGESDADRLLERVGTGVFGTLDMLRRGRWSAEPVVDPNSASAAGGQPPPGDPQPRLLLEPDRASYSRAHAALAKVTYLDDGTTSWLMYVKASLTGDEPADVIQYHRGHVDFPQETTADQFFDEAQWESYRKLGEHIGSKALTPQIVDLVRSAEVHRP